MSLVAVDEGLVDERLEHGQSAAHDDLGGFEREPSAKDGTAHERVSFLVVQQLPRPVDGTAQTALPGASVARAAREQVEALVDARQHFASGEELRASGG